MNPTVKITSDDVKINSNFPSSNFPSTNFPSSNFQSSNLSGSTFPEINSSSSRNGLPISQEVSPNTMVMPPRFSMDSRKMTNQISANQIMEEMEKIHIKTVPANILAPQKSRIIKTSCNTQMNNLPLTLSKNHQAYAVESSDLLTCFSNFIASRCHNLKTNTFIGCRDVMTWMRNIDRILIAQGWQDEPFLNPATIVVLFRICLTTFEPGWQTNRFVKQENGQSKMMRVNKNGRNPSLTGFTNSTSFSSNTSSNGAHNVGNHSGFYKTNSCSSQVLQTSSTNKEIKISRSSSKDRLSFDKSESNPMFLFNQEFISGETIRLHLVAAAFVAYSYSGAEISYPSKPFLRLIPDSENRAFSKTTQGHQYYGFFLKY